MAPKLTVGHRYSCEFTGVCHARCLYVMNTINGMLFCCSKAAKLIMLGFKMMAVPSLEDAEDLVAPDTHSAYREWSQYEQLHRLSFDELMWVLDLANFKSCYRMVSFPI